MSSLSALNHAAQQQAAGLHAQLSKLLGPAASPPLADTASDVITTSEQQQQQLALHYLQSLAVANAALGRALATTQSSKQQQQQQPGTAEELEDVQQAYSRREQLLGDLLQQLDSSAQALRSQLDSCHKLLDTKPCMEDPEQIIRYAHTLRHGYAPLGSTPELYQVAPAPQLPFMLFSGLRQYHMDIAAQQQQQQQQQQGGALPGQQQQQQQGQLPALGAPGAAAQQQEVGTAAAAQQQQQQQAAAEVQQPALQLVDFRLNTDLDADDEDDAGDLETASEEEMSEDDYSDDQ